MEDQSASNRAAEYMCLNISVNDAWKSFMYMRNKIDPNAVHWGTPDVTGTGTMMKDNSIYNNCLCTVWQKDLDPEYSVPCVSLY